MPKRNAARNADPKQHFKGRIWLTVVLAILLIMVAVTRCTPHRTGAGEFGQVMVVQATQ